MPFSEVQLFNCMYIGKQKTVLSFLAHNWTQSYVDYLFYVQNVNKILLRVMF